jgi:hypothetical protein
MALRRQIVCLWPKSTASRCFGSGPAQSVVPVKPAPRAWRRAGEVQDAILETRSRVQFLIQLSNSGAFTSPRVRGEVASPCERVRGRINKAGLVEKPPHPETSLRFVVLWKERSPGATYMLSRKRGEVKLHTPFASITSRSRGMLRPSFARKSRPLQTRAQAIPKGTQATLKKGRREDRVRAAPAVSRAKSEKKTHTSIQVQRKQSGLPCAMVYGLYVISLATDFLSPSSLRSLLPKNLTPASGRQNHTTSPSASALFVKSASTSTASRPTSVTIAKRPSFGTGWRGISR